MSAHLPLSGHLEPIARPLLHQKMIYKIPLMPRLGRVALVIIIVCLASIFTSVILVAANGDERQSSSDAPAINPASGEAKAKITERFGKLPLSFEVNQGQTDPAVKFISRGLGYQLFLTGTEAVLRMQKPPAPDAAVREGTVLRLKMIGANTAARAEGQDELPGKVNYFKGNNPERWLRNLPTYARVNFKDVYPGIDVVYYGNQGELEYDFAVAPGADPKVIRFVIEGADKIRLDENGDLLLSMTHGDVRLHRPVLYQLAEGKRDEVKGEYVIKGNEIRFRVRSFDSSKPLIIDPVLSYSTLLGGSSNDLSVAIAVDSLGSAYVTGATQDSLSFPTTPGAFKSSGFTSTFITKLDATGSSLVYSTYLAGNSSDTAAKSIAVDGAGNAYITGSTLAADFPVVNGLKTTGNFFKTTNSAANWSNNNTGLTSDPRLVVVAPNAPNTLYVGTSIGPFRSNDGGATWTKTGTIGLTQAIPFALAVDPTNSATVYGGFLGGLFRSTNSGDNWTNLNVPLGNGGVVCIVFDPVTPSTIYVGANSGVFRSIDGGANWTPLNNFTPTIPGIRVLAIDPTNTSTIYAGTFSHGLFKTTNGGSSWSPMNNGMGGPSVSSVSAIAIDPSNTATVYSGHGSSGFFGSINKTINGGTSWTQLTSGVPTHEVTAIIVDRNNPSTVFASSNGSGVIKTTNGGTSWTNASQGLWNASVFGMATDPANSAILYAAAVGNSVNDAFVTKLNVSGSALLFSSYLGGSGSDFGNGIAVDSSGNIHVAGQTSSANYPVANPVQSGVSATEQCSNAFVTKINPSVPSLVFSTYLGGSKCDGANGVAIDISGNVYVTGGTESTDFLTANAFQGTKAESFTGDAFVTKLTGTGSLVYSTYLGGNSGDTGLGIAADPAGNAYVTGVTTSTTFPTANPIQAANGGSGGDVFVTKLNPQGSALIYSTYLGGTRIDSGRGIAADSTGNAYVTGFTSSSEFPLATGALRTNSLFYKSAGGGGNWTNDNYGLKASNISVMAVHPTQPATIYIGASNGMFRSTNGGRTWSAINNGLNNLGVVGLIINPSNPAILYVATNDLFNPNTGVYKSTDGGNSWVLRATGMLNTDVASLAIDPVSPQTLYAGTNSGPIYKTVDGADNWVPLVNSPSPVVSLSVDPHNHTIVFAAMHFSNGGILKSIDSGVTWQFVALHPPGQTQFVAVSPLTAGLVFASGSGGLIKSTDNGNNWSPAHPERGVVVFDPVNASTLYFVTFAQGVLKSTNAGQSWTSVNTGLPTLSHRALAIDPVRPSTVYLAAGDGFFDDDAFVTKINPTGSVLIYSTLLGGSPVPGVTTESSDQGFGIAIDPAGNAYVTGMTRAPGFPVTPAAYQPFNRGFSDAFISKLGVSFVISGLVLENGVVPSYDAEVVLNDGSSLTSVTTNSDGSYEFSRLRQGGNFTISAAKPHFTMVPASQTFNNLNSDQVLNFSANTSDSPFHTISGQITNNGVGVPGITVTLSGSQVGVRTTDSNGNYSFNLIVAGNYTVTPSGIGFTFGPTSQTFNPLSGPQTANFTANQQNFVVTNADNHGTGSLREAITNTNATPGVDNIVFNIPGSGVKVINLLTALPAITEAVVIDATTQPGYAGTPLIELDGAAAGFSSSGFTITASGTTVRGFAIGRFGGSGIAINGCDNNVIQANYIGIDATGTTRKQNNVGIALSNSSGNLIGGTTSTARNVISGNSFDGIEISGSNNVIQGNFIGTNPTGTAAMGNNSRGIEFGGSNNLIGGTTPGAGNLISGNQTGISSNASGNTIQGNLIGTDVTGTAGIANNSGMDIRGSNNLVGGLTPAARNIISGNGLGVFIGGTGSKLQGNFIGTDITGTLPLGNGGIGVIAGENVLIGGTVAEARNVIAANGVNFGEPNISIGFNLSDINVTVQGNYIGTDVTGTRALGATFIGIHIGEGPNLIGGTAAGAGNVISGNGTGIRISDAGIQGNTIQGNRIGLNALGNGPLPNTTSGIEIFRSSNNTIGGTQNGAANTIAYNNGSGILIGGTSTGNVIRGNSIFSNAALGIDLTTSGFSSNPNGVTANDPNDADIGPNTLQNFPLLTSVVTGGGNTTIQGSLNSTPNTAFQIDFYSSAALDPSGNGEGALFFNSTSVNTDNSGNATINVTFPIALPAGRIITATATNPTGNTSEFSATSDASGATGSLQFTVATSWVIEDVGMANVTVVRQGGTSGNLSIEYATANGTAIAGQDYTAISGTLNFNSGETSKTIQVPILDDAVTEQEETFTISLRNAPNLEMVGAPSVQTINVQDHSTVPFIAMFDATPVFEGNVGTTTEVTFNLVLSAATGRTVSINYATENMDASGGAACGEQGVDYESKSGTITFQPGTSTATITVRVCGDRNAEANEMFVVALSNPSNATQITGQGFATINNDDVLELILEESGPGVNQAAVLSELFVRDPFTRTIPDFVPNRTDRGNRVIFLANNLQLNPGEVSSAVVVRFIDSNNQVFDVPAEDVRSVPGFDFTQVMVMVPSNVAAGTCTVTIRAHRRVSNLGTIRIAP